MSKIFKVLTILWNNLLTKEEENILREGYSLIVRDFVISKEEIIRIQLWGFHYKQYCEEYDKSDLKILNDIYNILLKMK